MGFRREVEDIISYLPDKNRRQTLLFSATVPPEVKAVMSATMRSNFVTVDCIHDTDPMSHTNSQVDQSHVIVPSSTRLVTGTVDILCKLIKDTRAAGEPLKLVVFFNTAHLVGFYAALFNDGLGIPVLELHSRKSQSYRTRTADAFRAASESILFTSDVSARGVDYPGVTDVVQVRKHSLYCHMHTISSQTHILDPILYSLVYPTLASLTFIDWDAQVELASKAKDFWSCQTWSSGS